VRKHVALKERFLNSRNYSMYGNGKDKVRKRRNTWSNEGRYLE
jgi:hypothetical protein